MGQPKPHTGWLAALSLAVACGEAATAALRPRGGVWPAPAVPVAEHFSHQEIGRARRYGRPQLALSVSASLIEAGVLAALARRPPRLPSRLERRPLAAAAVTGAGLALALTGATLPVSALMRKRALDVGLATQSWRGWAVDLGKSTAIGGSLAAGGGALALGLMRRHGDRWWLAGGVAAAAAGATMTFAGPVLLDPLFNRFTPLADPGVRDDVLELAGAAGVRVENVYQVDASRRTSAANAYVNGLGTTRRVVLFDTLLETFTRAETRLVVAHELAHVRHRDVPRSLAHLALVAPVALRAADRLARRLDRVAPATPARLPGLALGLGVAGAALMAPVNRLSRAVERRADSFALELTGAPAEFTSFERRIVVANLADPDPPRWIAGLLASHPPAVERIGIAQAYAQRQPAGSGGPPTRDWTRRTPAGS
jgi:STE24 endopeptidase